jgi:glycosyltransferase involved in cell wall biosynthesis
MSIPLISVILPVFNAEKYIFKAVSSILNQTLKDFELLIYDDGSSDSSIDIIRGFNDSRVIIYSDGANLGYIRRLNFLIQQSKGEYIARMDADDICHPERLQRQFEYLQKHSECDVLGTRSKTFFYNPFLGFSHSLPLNKNQIEAYCLFDSPMVHPSVIIRRSLINKGLYNYREEFYPAEDFDLWARLITKQVVLANLNSNLIYYRRHNTQTSVVRRDLADSNSFKIRKSYLEYFLKRKLTENESSALKSVFLQRENANLETWTVFIKLYTELYEMFFLEKERREVISTKVYEMIFFSRNPYIKEILKVYNTSSLVKQHTQLSIHLLNYKLELFLKKIFKSFI